VDEYVVAILHITFHIYIAMDKTSQEFILNEQEKIKNESGFFL
jgi:hypothetical protein